MFALIRHTPLVRFVFALVRHTHTFGSFCVHLEYRFLQNHIRLGLARTVYVYVVPTALLAGKSPNIRSYTVLIYAIFWQDTRQIYGHIRCVYTRFWPTLHKSPQPYTFLANPTRFWLTLHKSPNIRSYTRCIHTRFWPTPHKSPQPYTFLASFTHFWPTLHVSG